MRLPTFATPSQSSTSDGPVVCDFAQTFLHVSKGRDAGRRLELVDWQSWLMSQLYERRVDGRLRYRRALVGLPRKNGKSLLGSVVALNGLVEGGLGAEVYSAAGDRQQARIVFNEAKWQVQNSPALAGICKVYRDAIEVPATGAIYRVLSSDAKLQQGLNPSTVVFDELHVQRTDDLWDALTLGSGARVDPLVVGITTAGYDFDTICGRLYQYGKQVAAGDVVDASFGFWWWEATEGCSVFDRDAWSESNPNLELGLLDVEDMDVSSKQTGESAFRRYRLNQWVRALESWLPAGAWEQGNEPAVGFDPERPVWVGLDMALKHDSIAVVIAQPQEDGRIVTRARIWMPDSGRLEVAAVEHYLRDVHQRFDVVEFAYDPAYFQRSAEILADDGLPMVEFPQSRQRMVPACGHAYELIVAGKVLHDGSPVYTDQVLSAAQRMTDDGWRLSKGKSRRKIDAAIALVIALDRATMRYNPELYAPSIVKVWDD
jgi:phage terminase large subunit-like protein